MSDIATGARTPAEPRGQPTVPAVRPPGRFGRRLGYLLAGLPLGVVAFVVAAVGFAVGTATAVVWVGLPVLGATLRACRGLAGVERRATVRATGRDLPPHHYRQDTRPLADPQCWRDLLHAVLGFPVRLAAAVLAAAWGLAGAAGLLAVTWTWALPGDGPLEAAAGVDSPAGETALTTVAGLLLLGTLPLVVRGLVAVRAGLARVLLANPVAALRARAARLEAERTAAVRAEAATLRRVERDLHDGPQQRLVRMDLDLEAALRRLDDDPAQARPLVAGALAQNREALAELRALARGIAPPVLADRGLGAALAAAAARCPVEVRMDVAVSGRLGPAVENAAYFVVSEALANVAKHAAATRCSVTVAADARRVLVRVEDDGRGGAHPGKGHGLAGLADRVAALDGTFQVTSPAGGPTLVTASIPVVGG